jgi:hypothetical protein
MNQTFLPWVDHTHHAGLAMAGLGAVEEYWIGISDINSECLSCIGIGNFYKAAVESAAGWLTWVGEISLSNGMSGRKKLEDDLATLWSFNDLWGETKAKLADSNSLEGASRAGGTGSSTGC